MGVSGECICRDCAVGAAVGWAAVVGLWGTVERHLMHGRCECAGDAQGRFERFLLLEGLAVLPVPLGIT